MESPKRKRESLHITSHRKSPQQQLLPWVNNGINSEGDTAKEDPSFKVNLKKKKLINSNVKRGSRLLRSFSSAQKDTVNNEKKQGGLSLNLREQLKKTREQMADSWSRKSQSSKDSSDSQEEDIDSEAGTCSIDKSTDQAGRKDPNRVYKSTDSKEDSSDDDFNPRGENGDEEGLQDTSEDDNNSGNMKCNEIKEEDESDGEEGEKTLLTEETTNQSHNNETTGNNSVQMTHDMNENQDSIQDNTIVDEGRANMQDTTNINNDAQDTETINTDQEIGQDNNSVSEGRVMLNGDDQNNNEEDDINTQASDQTFTHQNTNLPQWFRFRLIVKIPQPPVEVLAQQQRGETIPEEYQDNDKRLLNVLKKFVGHIKSFDETAMIMEWSSKNDNDGVEAILNVNGIPSAPSDIKTFFEGFKGKKSGPVYIKFRATTKYSPEDFHLNAKTWLSENDCSLMKCPIQAENSEEIGWLAYTSQYSDKAYIAQQLEKMVGFEVGVRLASIAPKAEQNLDWKKKSRGLIVVVPTEKASLAKKRFNTLFRARKEHNYENPNPIHDIFHQFTFLPLESDLAKMPKCKTNYAVCLHRHQVHDKSIQARFMPDFLVDIDKKINTIRGRLSLRQMIMNIKSTKEETKGSTLFQSVDKIEDSSKVYFPYDRKVGPGTPGYIFQFYQCLEEEANVMFQGLGVYLEKQYGIENIHALIGINHWAENEQWHWDKKESTFITPEELMVEEYVHFDSNAKILDTQSKKLDSTKQSDTAGAVNTIMHQQQQELINILQNPDLDPITTLDQPIRQLVEEVSVNDQASTTSSITFGEMDNPNDASSQSTKKTTNNNSKSPSSSIGSIGTKTMRDLIDPTLSAAENRQRLTASTQLRMTRLQQRQEQLDLELRKQQLQEEKQSSELEDMDKLLTRDNITTNMENLNIKKQHKPASGVEAGTGP